MDHVLKELLEEIKEQNEDILDDMTLIKEKLGIKDEDVLEDDDKEEKDLDF